MTRRQHVVALLLLVVVATACAGGSQAKRPSDDEAAADFVRRSCRSTRYPRVCESTLLPCTGAVGRSPRRQLVLLRPRQHQRRLRGDGAHGGGAAPAVGVGDGADGPRFAWHLSNVQTWASAALTDADTCLDSLRSGRDEDAVRRRVLAVAQATSNALALVNKLDPAPPPPPPRLVTAVNNDGVTNNKAHRVQTTLHSTPPINQTLLYCTYACVLVCDACVAPVQ
jgi:hypothetical protein